MFKKEDVIFIIINLEVNFRSKVNCSIIVIQKEYIKNNK